MAKRRTHDSDQRFADTDSPLGLTGAFAPVSAEGTGRYDDPVGLTQAFGPVELDDEQNRWDTSEKWSGFDWEAPVEGGQAPAEEAAAADPEPTEDAAAPQPAPAGGRHARHAAPEPEISPRMQRSRRTRRRLVVVLILLLILFVAAAVAGYRILTGSLPFVSGGGEDVASSSVVDEPEDPGIVSHTDTQEQATQLVDIPQLAPLFGKTQDEALAQIQRGALITSTHDVNEKGSAIKQSATVELTTEPGNARNGGTPKVYLGMDKKGAILQVGYSAPAGLMGYDTMNFRDAVVNEHIIERTLAAIGADVPDGSAVLPDDAAEYTTYADDGTTVAKERCAFDGDVTVGGIDCSWSAVLSYDYTTANISGNASETVRLIYVYLTEK